MSDDFTLYNHKRGNSNEFEHRPDAQEQRQDQIGLGATPEQLEIFPPGTSPPGDSQEAKADGGTETIEPDFEDQSEESEVSETAPVEQTSGYDLPDKPDVDKNPIEWMPSHFIDDIQGVPTVNRMGYCILCEQYGVSVKAEPVTLPSETDFEYAEFRAVATTEDGQEYTGFGSAHVDRQDGDDPYLLAELAETRSLKRAAAWATGIGMTAAVEMGGSE